MMKLLTALNFILWGVWFTFFGMALWLHFPKELTVNLVIVGTLLAIVSLPAYYHFDE